jgi:hypothetical protein
MKTVFWSLVLWYGWLAFRKAADRLGDMAERHEKEVIALVDYLGTLSETESVICPLPPGGDIEYLKA